MKEKAKKIIIQILLVYFCAVAALYLVQRKMIFFPSAEVPNVSAFKAFDIEDIELVRSNGNRSIAWYRAPQTGKETLVFFHGNASNHVGNVYLAALYLKQGYGFLSVGYPGYGGNDGKPSEQGLYDAARSSITYLLNEVKIPENQIVLYGQSIGTGVAVQMATEFKNVRAVVLESPYTSLPDVAAKRYFFVPVRLLMKDKFDSFAKIKTIKAPLFVIQGMNDLVIPPSFGQRLFDTANGPKEILKLEGYGHNDLPDEMIFPAVEKFLNKQ